MNDFAPAYSGFTAVNLFEGFEYYWLVTKNSNLNDYKTILINAAKDARSRMDSEGQVNLTSEIFIDDQPVMKIAFSIGIYDQEDDKAGRDEMKVFKAARAPKIHQFK